MSKCTFGRVSYLRRTLCAMIEDAWRLADGRIQLFQSRLSATCEAETVGIRSLLVHQSPHPDSPHLSSLLPNGTIRILATITLDNSPRKDRLEGLGQHKESIRTVVCGCIALVLAHLAPDWTESQRKRKNQNPGNS